jgi:hypothetical protein
MARQILSEAAAMKLDLSQDSGLAIHGDKLTQWLATEPISATTAELRSHALRAWAKKDPSGAADYFLANPMQPPASDENTMSQMIRSRPDGFVAKVNSYGGRISTLTQLQLTSSLAAQRPQEVADFINTMAPSPTRITLAWSSVRHLTQERQYQQAFQFAQKIESGGARLDALAQANHAWMESAKDNPQEAEKQRAAFENLSPAEKAYVEKNDGGMPGVGAFFQ